MPEGMQVLDRERDPYAWATAQAALLRRSATGLKAVDREGLCEFLEEWADEMDAVLRSRCAAAPRLS